MRPGRVPSSYPHAPRSVPRCGWYVTSLPLGSSLFRYILYLPFLTREMHLFWWSHNTGEAPEIHVCQYEVNCNLAIIILLLSMSCVVTVMLFDTRVIKHELLDFFGLRVRLTCNISYQVMKLCFPRICMSSRRSEQTRRSGHSISSSEVSKVFNRTLYTVTGCPSCLPDSNCIPCFYPQL